MDISHSRDNEEACTRLRRLFGCSFWKRSQALSMGFNALTLMGPVLLFSMDPASPVRREVSRQPSAWLSKTWVQISVTASPACTQPLTHESLLPRRQVLSICCANLLIVVLRLALTFGIIHTIMEARDADNDMATPAQRGLSAQSISRLRSYEFRSASSIEHVDGCSICLSEFQEDEEVMHLPCDERHAFHAGCITQWLLKCSNCPLCQRTVEEPAGAAETSTAPEVSLGEQ